MKRKLMAAAVVLSLLLTAGCRTAPAGGSGEASSSVNVSSSVQAPDESSVQERPGDVSAPPAQEPVQEPVSQPEQPEVSTPEQPTQEEPEPAARVCTVSISCKAILTHMDWLDKEKEELVPQDGWLLPAQTVELSEGESAFDVLLRLCREKKLHMEYSQTPVYGSAYVEGIGNLYEFDCGEQSGWMYSVNGVFPNVGCSQYILEDGDRVEWVYTCDYGADVGAPEGQG